MNKLQGIMLDMYKEIKQILDRHGLRYFAIGGTCIGAVREHGFIPWDVDMDLAMPEPDYYQFIACAKEELPAHLGIFERTVDHFHEPVDAARVHDKRTTFLERQDEKYPDEYKGVFIDILPLCGVPSEPKEQKKFCTKFKWYIRLNKKRRYTLNLIDNRYAKILWFLVFPLRVLPKDFWVNKLHKLKSRYPYDEMELTGDTWVADISNLILPKTIYEDYIDLPFEDTVMRCSANYDAYLTKIFGDYMTPPPKEQRAENHADAVLIDPDRPYTYYQEMYKKTRQLKKENE